MPVQTVDIVFVIDIGADLDDDGNKVKGFKDSLNRNLRSLIESLQQSGLHVRYGLVAHAVDPFTPAGDHTRRLTCAYCFHFLRPVDELLLHDMYHDQYYDIRDFFTDDAKAFQNILDELHQVEPHLHGPIPIALDLALDFPFGPLATTRRVIALISDRTIEGGRPYIFGTPIGGSLLPKGWKKVFPKLVDKIMARKIMLYGFIPESAAALELAEAERSEIVLWDSCIRSEWMPGSLTLSKTFSFDRYFESYFAKLLKSISASSMQGISESEYSKALFYEDVPGFLTLFHNNPPYRRKAGWSKWID